MKKVLAFVFLLGCLFGTKPLFADVMFYDDAEDAPKVGSDWRLINPYNKSSINASGEQARTGNKSYKYSFVPDSSVNGGIHIELRMQARGVSNFSYNRDYWMGYSVYIPSDFVFPDDRKNEWVLLGQFHGIADACETAKQGPVMAFYVDGELGAFKQTIGSVKDFCFNGNNINRRYYTSFPPLKKGAWNDVVMNFRYNYNDSGNPFFKVWIDGKLIVDDKGPNCYNDAVPPFFKMGIYSKSSRKMTVFYDEIRVGDENSSYEEVAPRGSRRVETNAGLEAPTLRLVPTNN